MYPEKTGPKQENERPNRLTIYYYSITSSFRLEFKKLLTVVEGDTKAPFSIATTPRCRRRHYSIPRIAPLHP